uniref:Uncharacterized protein n=1 Tax=Cacopsylla melanoneura TaxID=428564 RepID=A0A8D8PXF8_9HEMI
MTCSYSSVQGSWIPLLQTQTRHPSDYVGLTASAKKNFKIRAQTLVYNNIVRSKFFSSFIPCSNTSHRLKLHGASVTVCRIGGWRIPSMPGGVRTSIQHPIPVASSKAGRTTHVPVLQDGWSEMRDKNLNRNVVRHKGADLS